MKKTAFAMIVLAAFLLTGCGGAGGDTPEKLGQDMVANMKEMGAILTGITDEASAKAAVPKIDAVRAKMRGCRDRAKKMPMPDPATEKKFNESMQAGMMEAMQSIGAAQANLAAKPELMAIIEPALQGMENDL